MLKVIVVKDYAELSKKGAEIIAETIKASEKPVLGLATGSSPIGTYQNLIAMHKAGELSFANVSSYNLDEYCGISVEHPQSYYYFMHEQLFNHVDMNEANVHIPSAAGPDLEADCKKYNAPNPFKDDEEFRKIV